jgi:O-antigen/teichoic acid export membrane protein
LGTILNNKIALRFAKNFSWLFLMNLLGYVFSIISFPILISKYGLKEVGIIFTVQSIVLIIGAIANYSLNYFIPTVSKKISGDPIYFMKLWNLTILIRTGLSTFLAIVSSLIVYGFFREYLLIWLLSLSLLIPKIINPTLFCNALESNSFVFKIGFFSKLLFLILIYIDNSSNRVNFFLALSELVVIILYLKKIHVGLLKFYWINWFELKQFIRQTFNLFLVNFFLLLKPNAILPCVSYLLGFEFTALFAIAQKVINVIKGISGITFTSFFPIYNKGILGFSFLNGKRIIPIFILLIMGVVGLWYLSPTIIYYLNNFQSNLLSTRTLQILSLSVPIFFMIIPLFSYLLNHNKWRVIMIFSMVQLLVLIVAWGILFNQNIIGVAKSLVVSEYTLFLSYLLFILKYKGNLEPEKKVF